MKFKKASDRDNYIPEKFSSIREMVDLAVAEAGDKDAYRFRKGRSDEIEHVTFRQFKDDQENLGAALTELGYGSSHIAVMSENRYEWINAYVTVLKSAGVVVPIDRELPVADKITVLNDSDSEVLIFSTKYSSFVKENKDKLPNIKLYINFDAEEDEADSGILSYKKLIAHGAELDKTAYDSLKSDENDLKSLVYTSGTTGMAKGVMLSEHNLCCLVYYGLLVSGKGDVGLSVLPFHHTYEANAGILVCIHTHSTICINNSLRNIVKDLQLFKPEFVQVVPALLEFIYNSILKNIKAQGKEKTFNNALKLSETLRKVGIDQRRKIFSSIHETFGGNLNQIVCGGAALRPEVGEFFEKIGILVQNGYGITECSPIVAVNDVKSVRWDTAGHRLECIEWKIDQPNEEGIGEILVKGDTVMLGYYKQPEKTAEVFEDGWFHTGDYGKFTKDEQIMITGRKKNIIVLNNGKNIYPEEIEGYIAGISYVTEVIVKSIKDDKNEEIGLLAEIYIGEESDRKQLAEGRILDDIHRTMKELPSYKQVTEVVIRDTPFDKTTSNKIKRTY